MKHHRQHEHHQQQSEDSRRTHRYHTSTEISYGSGANAVASGMSAEGTPSPSRSYDDLSDMSEGGRSTTVAVIVVSLLFVAIFAGALVGGVVSGDPSNVFFVTIITASVVAVCISLGVAVWYCRKNGSCCCCPTDQVDNVDGYLSKNPHAGTFSTSEDEDDPKLKGHQNNSRGHAVSQHPYAYRLKEIEEAQQRYNDCPQDVDLRRPARTPIEARIKEIQAGGSVAGFSALSPQTFGDLESLSTRPIEEQPQLKKQRAPELFDFANVALASPAIFAGGRNANNRVSRAADPPEGNGPAVYNRSWAMGRMSMDPSAKKVTAGGELVDVMDADDDQKKDEHCNDVETKSVDSRGPSIASPSSIKSRYDVKDDNEVGDEEKDGEANPNFLRRSRSRSRSRSKSPSKSKSPGAEVEWPEADKNLVVPPTPAASDVGSVASSFFRQIGRLAGGKKKTVSEAGYSEASSHLKDGSSKGGSSANSSTSKSETKQTSKVNSAVMPNHSLPPKAPVDGKEKEAGATRPPRSGSNVVGSGIPPPPATSGRNSTFTIPPPRHVPSTPGAGSVAFSEYRSMVGSTAAASSTFDPVAHQRALQRIQNADAALGAGRVNDESMPIYYEEDDKATSIASYMPSNGAYDVFAPPGPIGIVVDTTKKGCIVHSLKKSSPMQGLINPGDLIIALDDFDVRKMNAASLTKLMAKKSKQPERKFTLEPTGELP